MTNEKDMKKEFNIDEFLAEIGRAQLLSIEEELALIKAIQEKGPECERQRVGELCSGIEMKKLIERNRRFVVSVANQYQDQGLALEELIEAPSKREQSKACFNSAERKEVRP